MSHRAGKYHKKDHTPQNPADSGADSAEQSRTSSGDLCNPHVTGKDVKSLPSFQSRRDRRFLSSEFRDFNYGETFEEKKTRFKNAFIRVAGGARHSEVLQMAMKAQRECIRRRGFAQLDQIVNELVQVSETWL